LMSESLRNDGRIWVPAKEEDVEALRNGRKKPVDIPEADRDYYLERRYPAFGNLVPRDVASRAAKERCDAGFGVGTGLAVYLDFADAIKRLGKHVIEERYGNLFQMYEKIVDENPYETPMMIYPAIHYCMGGIWVDYELMTNIPGLFSIGESNFSDHGANRLGASALMQGLADGYFILPYTIQNYLSAEILTPRIPVTHPEFEKSETQVRERISRLIQIKGNQSVDHLHRKFGLLLWETVGMERNKTGLEKAIVEFKHLREEFWSDARIPGGADELNPELEKAGRVADFIEIGELMARDALLREESCGVHFREEYQTDEGEAKRNDDDFMYVAAWEYNGTGNEPVLHKEPLQYENIKVQSRNYKI
jgi:succinate dehydrogenase / fumarate reductase flavoprotein subunit